MVDRQIWFKHDLGARNDPKLLKIKRKYGFEGIGVFWSLVETFYEYHNEMTKDDLNDFIEDNEITNTDMVLDICKICFKVKNGVLYSPRIAKGLYVSSDNNKRNYNGVRVATLPEWMEEDE